MAALVAAEAGKPVDDDETEDDFGLYYPAWYALATWQDYRRHHLLPEAGGLNDQDWQWWEDMRTLNARYHRAAAAEVNKPDDDTLTKNALRSPGGTEYSGRSPSWGAKHWTDL